MSINTKKSYQPAYKRVERVFGCTWNNSALWPVFIVIVLMFIACSRGANSPPSTPTGPTLPEKRDLFQADPTILEENGTFYLYGTNDESPDQGFQVYSSTDLKVWKGPEGYRNGYALSRIENYGNRGFWAPQVFKAGDKYYMAYTADEHIAISMSERPTGPFVQKDQKGVFSGSKREIDPFVYTDEDGKKYLFYVDISNGNKIFMTGLNDDFMSVKDQTGVECLRTTEGWENKGQPSARVIEGPTVIKRKGFYYLLYSANHFENPNYAVGYAISEDINGPWRKVEENPILSIQKINWAGTGHGDLIMRADGSVYSDNAGFMYYVFHTHNAKDGLKKIPRRTAIIKMQWKETADGPDVLEVVPGSFEHLKVTK